MLILLKNKRGDNMKVDLVEFFVSSIKSIIFGVIFLLLAFLVLPDVIILKSIRFIKPSLLKSNDKLFYSITNLVLKGDYIRYQFHKQIDIKLEEVKVLKNELDQIEENLFIMDSLIGIFDMLMYIVSTNNFQTGLFEETSQYFINYCNFLYSKCDENLSLEISTKFIEFEDRIYAIKHKDELATDGEGNVTVESCCKIAQGHLEESRKFGIYLRDKSKEFKRQREQNKNEIVLKIKEIMEIKHESN